jgi:hypothetical protein
VGRGLCGAALMVAVTVSATASGCGSNTATPGSAPPSTHIRVSKLTTLPARSIVRAALRAAKHAGSVHVHIASSAGGGFVQDDEAGRRSGSQQVHVSSLRMTVRVVGSTAYVKVTHTGGEFFLGMAGVSPSRYVDRWISYRPGDPDYAKVASSVTMASLLSYMKPRGSLSKAGTSVVAGHPAIGVWGGYLRSRGCLYVSTAGPPLPLRLTLTTIDGTDVTISFSHWGEAVHVVAPPHAVPAVALSGSS